MDLYSYDTVKNMVKHKGHDIIEEESPRDYLWAYINYVWQAVMDA